MKIEIEVRCTDDEGRHTAEKTTRLGDFNYEITTTDGLMARSACDVHDMLQRAKNGFRFNFDEDAFHTAIADGTY